MCAMRRLLLAVALVVLARAARVGPAIAGLAGRAVVDVDEAARRVEADAHAAGVERLGELVHRVNRDALDADVHRGRVVVAARVALFESEARNQLDSFALKVIEEPRELLVELGAHRANRTGARAAEQLV